MAVAADLAGPDSTAYGDCAGVLAAFSGPRRLALSPSRLSRPQLAVSIPAGLGGTQQPRLPQ